MTNDLPNLPSYREWLSGVNSNNDGLERSLDALTRLRDAGYITLAEFTQKRTEILNRLAPSGGMTTSAQPPAPAVPLVPSASNGYRRPLPGLKDRKPKVWIASSRVWIASP
ncbi:SHOCT domain-containing protein [Azospirillum agricola]|uniref:SHOCT domain-containing protein n=1 Tax=Azospirillum agricola TaxID=1720247 RepID=UPI0011788C01|nr:SHOCT domain-containing protein [Azospirillum agricola]